MTERAHKLRDFIQQAGWADADRTPLAGDASNRRYDRLIKPDGTRAVLMDAPPDKGEKIGPFVRIAQHLGEIGLSAPDIFAQDQIDGFLLLEDLGDALFARVLEQKPHLENSLYSAAIDTLVHVYQKSPPDLTSYDSASAAALTAPAFDWYQLAVAGSVDAAAKADCLAGIKSVLAPFDGEARVLMQRDYHAENLLWLPDREGSARVGLLDFQDAMLGHPAYDLVSVLQDARRDLRPETERQMIARFLKKMPRDLAEFSTAYAAWGAQRNLRILGVLTRLCLRNGKAHYVDLIPRVWGHAQTNLKHPALSSVAAVVEGSLPPPTHDVLEKLRVKCATCPNL
ncbi:phosphotransferase [uncultured Roseobacter sp.]|uniref:aminoglycoside phosphotransferase family protein n=1 Tax=uncultured Roseobacter sp. TaxID=114847 RepID=UPI002636BC9F|nr:phosphotransferase [uncultured Roseobacter sp.]